ncbi:hypothetical protein B0H10DRAFT_2440631 [Mycena sp. CBHHK59/15]|nr:hypothetical protein B0H10DRAFT_2440631 [Mycena sp. CBHHK59/15]
MEDSDWVPVGLSAQVISTIADLRSSIDECNLKFQNLESAIQSASTANPVSVLPVTKNSEPSVRLNDLIKKACNNIWDKSPIRAIAKAHKETADRLADHGNENDDDPDNISKVYIEYARYLLLYPQKDDAEYTAIVDKMIALEAVINRGSTPGEATTESPGAVTQTETQSQSVTLEDNQQQQPGSLKKRKKIWRLPWKKFRDS